MKETTDMFQNNLYPNAQMPGSGYAENLHVCLYSTALDEFRSVMRKGKIARLKRRITRRRQRLYDLNDLKPRLSVRGSSYAGIRVVPINSIIGSEGRTADFDIDFYPMSEAAQERWVNMAIVYLSHLPLPPIQLVQIGEVYFVRDGHHRISVARALGQAAMDAEVIIWKALPPFPWQEHLVQGSSYALKRLDVSA